MFNKPKFIDETVQKICACLPEGLKDLKTDTEKNIRAVVQAGFERMHLVTREEFSVQEKILKRTKQEVEQLEARIKQLEEKLSAH